MQHPTVALQGHLYEYLDHRVIALETGSQVEVAIIHDPWLGQRMDVRAEELTPLPMVYYHGEVPQ